MTWAAGNEVIYLLAGGGVIVLMITLFFGHEASFARRTILQFLVTIALPVFIIFALILTLLAELVTFDPRIWQALIAGVVIATGWLTTSIFSELERKRAKAEKLRDYHKAIYGEIRNALSSLYKEGRAEEFADEILEKMRADDAFVPFIPQESHDRVFSALVGEIEVLPRITIDVIIAFYSTMSSISELARDMRSPEFASALSQERRMGVYRDYVALRIRAFDLGQYTLGLINAYADDGEDGAKRYAKGFAEEVSSPAADRSHPSVESE